MTLRRFRKILEAYGAEPARWPHAERPGIEALLAASEEARRLLADAAALDGALDAWETPAAGLDPVALAAAASAGPRPRRESNGWRITIGWPNFAGLGAAVAAGFLIGFLGIGDVWLFAEPPADTAALGALFMETPLW